MQPSKLLLWISVIGLLAIFSSTASKSPTLPLFAKYLGAGTAEIGVIAAASTITGIIVNITAGTLSDIYGRRKLLVLSGFFFASSPFLYLLINNPFQLILVRVYHGVATAVFVPVATAIIADLYRENRGKVMGFFSSATLIGRLAAPTIAGVTITMYSFHGTYLLCGLLGLTAFMLTLRFPETKTMKARGSPLAYNIVRVLGDHRVLLAGLIMATTYFVMQAIETFLPLYLELIRTPTWLIGSILSLELAVLAVMKPYGGHLYDLFGAGKTLLVGSIVSGVSVALIGFTNNYVLVSILVSLFAVGVAFITASIPPLTTSLVDKQVYGTALGAIETIKDVGQALGPIITGLILVNTPYTLLYPLLGVFFTLATIIVAIPLTKMIYDRG